MRLGKYWAWLIVGAAALGPTDSQALVVLDFEGIALTYPFASNTVYALDYYNGGTSSAGTSGPNVGVEVGGNGLVICLNTLAITCPLSNTSRGGLAPGSDHAALFFTTGSATYINVAAGFDIGFAFSYVSVQQSGSVRVYDGLDGSGNLLASIALAPNATGCPGYVGVFCPFLPVGVAFNGVARSVFFAGVANQIVFDDITFGSSTPGVPEPATGGLMLGGLLALGSIAARRRRGTAALNAGRPDPSTAGRARPGR